MPVLDKQKADRTWRVGSLRLMDIIFRALGNIELAPLEIGF
jgi:hypothetical protein